MSALKRAFLWFCIKSCESTIWLNGWPFLALNWVRAHSRPGGHQAGVPHDSGQLPAPLRSPHPRPVLPPWEGKFCFGGLVPAGEGNNGSADWQSAPEHPEEELDRAKQRAGVAGADCQSALHRWRAARRLHPPASLGSPSQPPLPSVTTPDESPFLTFMARSNSLNFLQILLGPDMVGTSSYIH